MIFDFVFHTVFKWSGILVLYHASEKVSWHYTTLMRMVVWYFYSIFFLLCISTNLMSRTLYRIIENVKIPRYFAKIPRYFAKILRYFLKLRQDTVVFCQATRPFQEVWYDIPSSHTMIWYGSVWYGIFSGISQTFPMRILYNNKITS